LIRIGYVMGGFAPTDHERRLTAIRRRADPSIELHVVPVDQTMHLREWTPEDTLASEAAYVEAYRRAEREGCQAVFPDAPANWSRNRRSTSSCRPARGCARSRSIRSG